MYRKNFFCETALTKSIYPEKQVAKWASIRYADDYILDYMEVDASHAIFEVEVPEAMGGKNDRRA